MRLDGHIKNITALEILDSRGNPTIEAEVILQSGQSARAAVPSGASTGTHEAVERRDVEATRYRGRGVRTCVWEIENTIAPRLLGADVRDQRWIDQQLIDLDGTSNKSRLGANTLLALSLAVARAAAQVDGKPLFESLATASWGQRLPVPFLNLINGGRHATGGLPIQEIMVVPHGFPSFSDALRAGTEVYQTLRDLLHGKGWPTTVGDEGGFAPPFATPEDAFSLLLQAIEACGYVPGDQIALALDVAASEFYNDQTQGYAFCGKQCTADDMMARYAGWCRLFPIISIEDGLSEDDWHAWRRWTQAAGDALQLVGDDLFVTHPARLQQGIDAHVANAILIKPNQIGTLTETLEVIQQAETAHYGRIISHRSGETEDDLIADLAVACGAGQIKTGAPCRGERTAKYNQLLRIEKRLGSRAVFAGPEQPWKKRPA